MPRNDLVRLAKTNVAVSALFLLCYISAIALAPKSLGLSLLGAFVFTFLLSGLRPYLEHAGTDAHWLSSSQSWISKGFDLVYGGINYHLAHHISPAVPAYRIKAFHQWLDDNGHLQRDEIKVIHSLSEAYHTVSHKIYGQAANS